MSAVRIVTDTMDGWRRGIDAHDPDAVAAAFTEDAVFQGLRPYARSPRTTLLSPVG